MGNGNLDGIELPAGMIWLLTPHGERERQVAGDTLIELVLLTPHGERERGTSHPACASSCSPNPSWGTGTKMPGAKGRAKRDS